MQIRLATESDAEAIRAIYAPVVETTSISFETEPPTRKEMARRIREIGARHPFLIADGGYAYACAHHARAAYRWAVDVSVYLAPEARGRGLGRALYTRLFAILREQGFYCAYAGIALPNPASVGLHEAFGFKPIGIYHAVGFKFGRWHDVGWWELSLRERDSSPREPVGIHEVPDLDRRFREGSAW
jgi:L-amino acid N-acyltransferase YncA